ncbi:MAG: sigma-70 family RNA polymerase sigma factor [Verrucomicrobiales bacterium]|nr:sigma-70 family RNA polymerase sigma factor [Verrucomicrobiales bacterium]
MSTESQHHDGWSGDAAAAFATTHWSVVLAAQGSDSSAASTDLESLFRAYQRPLYSFIRRQGKAHHDAQDLIQAFFHHLLAKEALRAASRQRGRLRSFFLGSLKNFLANEHDRTQTLKRGGGQPHLSLDAIADGATVPEPAAATEPPERLFDREWAQTIFSNALRRLEQEFAADGKQAQFAALAPFLSQSPAPGDHERLAREIGIRSSLMATVVSRLRRRFRELVRTEIAATVATPAEVDVELSYLVELMAS